MIQRIVDIKTDGLSVFDKESRRLVLCLEFCGITVALVDKSNGHWVAAEVLQCAEEDVEDMDELMQQFKQHSSLLNYTGMETKIFVRTANAMPIPAALQNDADLLLQMQFGLQKVAVVIKEQVNDEMAVVLKTNADWLESFTILFPQATIHSSLGWLIKHELSGNGTNIFPVLHTVFGNGLLELTLVKNHELLIAKCFPFQTVEDMNYHLLNICKQLNISPAEVAVKVQGLVAEGSPLHQSLLKYFAHVQFANAGTADWGIEFKTIPDHYFTALINAS